MQEMQQKQQDIANQVMQGWVDSVQKEAVRIKELINSPEFLTKMQAESSTTLGQSQALVTAQLQHAYQTRVNIAEGMTGYINQAKADGSSVAVPLLATTLVLGGSLIGASMIPGGTQGTAQASPADSTSFSPLFDQSVVAVAPDMRAELGLLGTLMASSAMYQASASNFVEGNEDSEKKDFVFSKKYANNIIDLVRSRGLDAFINGVVLARMRGIKNLSDQRRSEMSSVVKAMLVVSAIGLMNKLELGHLTGIEFEAMVKGQTTNLPPEDERWTLVKLLNGHLDQLSPAEQGSLMIAFKGFMDSNPNAEGMLKMDRLFTGILAQMPQSQRVPSQKF
jgi:hypothetical protein